MGAGPAGPTQSGRAYLVALVGPQAGRKFSVDGAMVTVGSAGYCDVDLSGMIAGVAELHAILVRDDQGIRIQDESKGNLLVNGVQVANKRLSHGDRIRLGEMELRVLIGPTAQADYNEEVYQLGTVDQLTGAVTRRAFDQILEREVKRSVRYTRPLSLLFLDVDDLNRINTHRGRPAGDFVVRAIADVVVHRARKVDVVARFSGATFAVLLPEVPLEGARAVAETLRSLVAQQALMFGGRRLVATITVGLATVVGPDSTAAALADEAEQALLRGKAGGPNRVVGPGDPGPGEAG